MKQTLYMVIGMFGCLVMYAGDQDDVQHVEERVTAKWFLIVGQLIMTVDAVAWVLAICAVVQVDTTRSRNTKLDSVYAT